MKISIKIEIQVLVGGSSRIPKIRELLENKFSSDKLKYNINPDEVVAQGAAIFANAIEVENYAF